MLWNNIFIDSLESRFFYCHDTIILWDLILILKSLYLLISRFFLSPINLGSCLYKSIVCIICIISLNTLIIQVVYSLSISLCFLFSIMLYYFAIPVKLFHNTLSIRTVQDAKAVGQIQLIGYNFKPNFN